MSEFFPNGPTGDVNLASPGPIGATTPNEITATRLLLTCPPVDIRIEPSHGLYHTAVAGSGQSYSESTFRVVNTGTTANSGARWGWNNGAVNNSGTIIHSVDGLDFRKIPWGKRVELEFAVQLEAWNASTNGSARLYCGLGSEVPGYVLDRVGVGIHIAANRTFKLVAHNGTTLTESASLGTLYGAGEINLFRIISLAGTVHLYRGNALLGTITGGPSVDGAQNKCGISVDVTNGADAAAVTLFTGYINTRIYD